MDIDEFLDRELSDLGLSSDKTAGQNIELPGMGEQAESSPLFENIKASLNKGNLDEAEEAYVQLWHLLVQQKLKWNKGIYDQLAVLSRQFSGMLANAYDEVKKKADHIYELISRGKDALKEGKKELPFKLYSEMEGINNSIPNAFFEEKKIISQQITSFYQELRSTTDNELVRRVAALIQEINRLLDKTNNSIRSNDMINAIVSYNKCIEFYNQIPEGFLKYKNSMGMRLLDVYRSLSIYNEISNLQKQLSERQPPVPQQAFGQKISLHGSSQINSQSEMLSSRKERAKSNIKKGFYSEASKDIQEALRLEPNDAEAMAIHAKLKTLQ